MKVFIIDYNVGNLGSIKNMLKRIGVDAIISSDSNELRQANKLILPGIGRFDYGMEQLHKSGLIDFLNEGVLNLKIPILGICLGAQLLTEYSEEGNVKGLGFIKGRTVAFNKSKLPDTLKVPHMGWTNVYNYSTSKLFNNMYDTPKFYFVHSYHLQLDNTQNGLCTSVYGYEFYSGIEHKNILGVQFHPEKSHKYGMQLLKNFIEKY